MHILFVHQNYPAQFGHIAAYLTNVHGFRCTFVSEKPAGNVDGVERVQYRSCGGVTSNTHYCSATFEAQVRRSVGVFETLKNRPDIQPDLIVGHSGFVSTLYLRELYDCPIINYFELYYHVRNSDLDFRHDQRQATEAERLRARTRNATLLLDLDNCDAAYSPTEWQRSRLPQEYQHKFSTIFDGIDTSIWRRHSHPSRQFGGWTLPPDKRIVTYVSRGMESIRGFDIFMRVAKRLCEARSDVLFVVVGEDRVAYGGDNAFTRGMTFKQWVLSQDQYDLRRILFLGRLPQNDLAELLSVSDVHIYLTVPFVLSWSLMNALACGATVVASATAPVEEMVHRGVNGCLVDFFDVDQWVTTVSEILDDPAAYKHLGATGIKMIDESYSLEKCLPKMLDLYTRVVAANGRSAVV